MNCYVFLYFFYEVYELFVNLYDHLWCLSTFMIVKNIYGILWIVYEQLCKFMDFMSFFYEVLVFFLIFYESLWKFEGVRPGRAGTSGRKAGSR